MGTFGFSWVSVGSPWVWWVPLGFLGSLGFLKFQRTFWVILGYIWVLMDICRFPMGLVGSPGFLLVFLGSLGFMKFQRTFWVHLGSHGYLWFPIGFVGSPGFLGFL